LQRYDSSHCKRVSLRAVSHGRANRHNTGPANVARGVWQQQFMKDRYECLQEAQQPVSAAAVTPYYGGASSQIATNCGVWISCLGARGYVADPNRDLFAPPGMLVYCRK
jgi:hypothetical protein